MKKTRIIFACMLVLALAGMAALHAAEEGRKDGKATVRSVHGKVQYSNEKGEWVDVKVNMKLSPGVTVRTGPDGTMDLSVNGLTSAVRITNATTLHIPTMSVVGNAYEGDTTTMLKLDVGTVLCIVKKISANSRYEIMTPRCVAGIRGTYLGASVIILDNQGNTSDTISVPDGNAVVVPFSKGSGAVTAQAISLTSRTQVTFDGSTLTPGVISMSPALYQSFINNPPNPNPNPNPIPTPTPIPNPVPPQPVPDS